MPELLGAITPVRVRPSTTCRMAVVTLCALALGACAALSPDGGMHAVAQIREQGLNIERALDPRLKAFLFLEGSRVL